MKEGTFTVAERLMNFLEVKDIYGRNKKFTEYVNSCARSQQKTIEDILCQATTYEYYKSIMPGGCNFEKET